MLYLVATPIGNLGDITLRALETLRAVDLIASEDTRKTGLLLKHFDIHKPQIAFFEHNEERAGPRIIEALHAGRHTIEGVPGERVAANDATFRPGVVGVFVDPEATQLSRLGPAAVIDARMLKRPPPPLPAGL